MMTSAKLARLLRNNCLLKTSWLSRHWWLEPRWGRKQKSNLVFISLGAVTKSLTTLRLPARLCVSPCLLKGFKESSPSPVSIVSSSSNFRLTSSMALIHCFLQVTKKTNHQRTIVNVIHVTVFTHHTIPSHLFQLKLIVIKVLAIVEPHICRTRYWHCLHSRNRVAVRGARSKFALYFFLPLSQMCLGVLLYYYSGCPCQVSLIDLGQVPGTTCCYLAISSKCAGRQRHTARLNHSGQSLMDSCTTASQPACSKTSWQCHTKCWLNVG